MIDWKAAVRECLSVPRREWALFCKEYRSQRAKICSLGLIKMFNQYDAPNYIEFDLQDEHSRVLVTMRRAGGKSPGQMHREAREECDRLRAELDALRKTSET